MKYIILASALVSLANCLDFYITSPYDKIEWSQNEQVKITWDFLEGGSEVSSISLDLMNGPSENGNIITSIASGLPASTEGFEYSVPNDVYSGTDYFIRLTGNGDVPVVRYSGRFKVNGTQAPGNMVEELVVGKPADEKVKAAPEANSEEIAETNPEKTPEKNQEESPENTSETPKEIIDESSASILKVSLGLALVVSSLLL